MSDRPGVQMDDLDRLRLLDTKAAARLCGFHEEYWRELHREGKTPPAIRLGGRKLGWPLGTLIAWRDAMSVRSPDKAQEPIAA